jgi:hypothetical protein
MLKIIKQSKLWFYFPFAIFRTKKVMKWVMESNDYRESIKRNFLMECIVMLNLLYCIILFGLFIIFV